MINKDDSFWEGYKRTDETHDGLMLALDHALLASKSERLGQLLVNLKPKDKDLDSWLFNLYDEDLVKMLLLRASQEKLNDGKGIR